MDRTSIIQSLKNLSMKVTMDEQKEYYKEYKSPISQIATVKPITDMKGGVYETMSISGETELYEREENEEVQFKDFVEGYPIIIKKRSFDLGIKMSFEMDEDFEQIKGPFQEFLKGRSMAQRVETTAESIPPETPITNPFCFDAFIFVKSHFTICSETFLQFMV